MEKKVIYNHDWSTPTAVISGGFIFLSGTTSKNQDGSYSAAGDIVAQTHIILDRIEKNLQSIGSKLENIVKIVVYLDSMNNWKLFDDVYIERFQENRPARTTIQVGGFEIGACIEIDVIAIQ